jgi:hypothetical protein
MMVEKKVVELVAVMVDLLVDLWAVMSVERLES